jgi:hypothetical protein
MSAEDAGENRGGPDGQRLLNDARDERLDHLTFAYLPRDGGVR